jgi:hypothetical protein
MTLLLIFSLESLPLTCSTLADRRGYEPSVVYAAVY